MNFWIPLVCLVGIMSLLGILAYLIILFKVINQLTKVNEQLLVVVAGKDEKPETLRALVASAKPPQKNLPGIAAKKKAGDDKPKNTNYTMEIGVTNGL